MSGHARDAGVGTRINLSGRHSGLQLRPVLDQDQRHWADGGGELRCQLFDYGDADLGFADSDLFCI